MRLVLLLAVFVLLCVPAVGEVQTNQTVDFNAIVSTCSGNTVLLSGPLHVLISSTVNGNNVSGTSHFQPQGVSGVDLATGTKYQATGGTLDKFQGSLQNGKFTETFVNNFRIVGQGPANNLEIHEVFHVTVDANGTVSVIFDKASTIECK